MRKNNFKFKASVNGKIWYAPNIDRLKRIIKGTGTGDKIGLYNAETGVLLTHYRPNQLTVKDTKQDHGLPECGEPDYSIHDERELQRSVASYLDNAGEFWIHIANERRTTKGAKYKRMGVKAGAPDVFMFRPNQTCHGLAIELKTYRGKLSIDQISFLTKLRIAGYAVCVCRSLAGVDLAIRLYNANEL